MEPVQAIRTGLAGSFQFSGRATRSEFWWLWAFALTLQATIGPAVDFLLFGADAYLSVDSVYATPTLLLLICPALAAVNVRRMHDVGLPGLWAAVPPVGIAMDLALRIAQFDVRYDDRVLVALVLVNIAVIFIACVPSASRPNRYGPPPA